MPAAPTSLARRRARTLASGLAGILLGIVAVLAIFAGSADAAPGCAKSTPLTGMSSTQQSPCWEPFTAGSPFNTRLPTHAKAAADNGRVHQHMATYGWSLDGSAHGFSFSGDGTRPVYFARPSDPTMTVRCTSEEGPTTCQGANDVDVDGARIHVPAGARPGDNWDAHMIVIETASGDEYDLWHARISGKTIVAGTGSEENVNTSDGTADSGDAAAFALTAGLLRPSELASGHIDHPLVITVPCTNANGPHVGYTWPATGGWGEYCGEYWKEEAANAPEIGQLLQLNMTDRQIARSGAPAWERTIMTALAHYGAYIEDTNGSWHDDGMYIESQDPASWTNLGEADQWKQAVQRLGGHGTTLSSGVSIPVSRLQVVNPCVPRGTCPAAGGAAPHRTSKRRRLSRVEASMVIAAGAGRAKPVPAHAAGVRSRRRS